MRVEFLKLFFLFLTQSMLAVLERIDTSSTRMK